MATITLNEHAPSGVSIHFSFASEEFDLKDSQSFDSDDTVLVSAASVHPWLSVSFPDVAADTQSTYDASDPHDNPSIDHLSSSATPETKAAAEAAEAAIRAEVDLNPDDFHAADPAPAAPATVDPAVAKSAADAAGKGLTTSSTSTDDSSSSTTSQGN